MLRSMKAAAALALAVVLTSFCHAQQPRVEELLIAGKLADAEKMLAAHLGQQAADDQARFELGVVQFLRAAEHLSQNLYRYGARTSFGGGALPLMQPGGSGWTNPSPEKLTYAGSRKIVQTWLDDLGRAQATLAQVKGANVKLPLHVAMIRLDFNGDGQAKEEEALWRVYYSLNRAEGVIDTGDQPEEKANKAAGEIEAGCDDKQQAEDEKNAKAFVIAFDAGDAHWLRGYCHFLMAMGEMILAHDTRELFERTAPLFFANVETPHQFLNRRAGAVDPFPVVDALDAIAFIHLLHLEVKEPQRMGKALEHFRSMIGASRDSWKLILAETDDQREWIPNPNQKTVVPETKVSPEMVKSWQTFLNEAEQILDGKKLVPFWRPVDGMGVNINKIFTEPRTFDLVLWIQGTAATPYLEKGPITSPDVWRQITDSFGGEFAGYLFWFN